MSPLGYQSSGAPQVLGQSRQKTTRKKPAVTAGGRLGSQVGSGIAGATPAGKLGAGVGAGVGSAVAAAQPTYSLGGDPGLMMAEDQAQRARAGADAQELYQTGALGASYGFDASGRIDMSNPFGRSALMLATKKRNERGTENSYASRGLLYSSARQSAQEEVGRNYGIQANQLAQQYQSDKAGVAADRLSAYQGAQDKIDQATYDALLRKLNGGK